MSMELRDLNGNNKYTMELLQRRLKVAGKAVTVQGRYNGMHWHTLASCDKCGHEWWVTPSNLLKKKVRPDCPECRKVGQ